jgi:triacylglycerol lipase
VHGFNGSSSGWQALEAALRAKGYTDSRIVAIDYDSGASNATIAKQIASAADALRRRTGASKVDIVSHSMGSISARYYLERLGGAAHVDAFVSLAGVNEGTMLAYGCYVLASCREMVPSSAMLTDLDARFPPKGSTRYRAWWSPCDETIIPAANAELRGATNTKTACLGHTEVRTDPAVLAQVVRFLAGRKTTAI